MKFFAAFVFCTLWCYNLALDCSLDIQLQCGKLDKKDWQGETWPESVRELDKACRNVHSTLECQIAYAEQCPKSLYKLFLNYMRESKKLYRKLCSKSDVFRLQFLEHVPCLNKNVNDLMQECRSTTKVVVNKLCVNSDDLLRCVVRGIEDRCRSGAVQVFDTLYEPTRSMDNIFCKKSYASEWSF